MKKYQPKSAEEKKAELNALTERITEGVKSFADSEKWKSFLRMSALFHKYSLQNQILIFSQMPTATQVAGFSTWKKLNRNVKAGEKGIRIFAPNRVKVEPSEEEASRLTGRDKLMYEQTGKIEKTFFSPTAVFDISQTEGEELTEICEELVGSVTDYEKLFNALCSLTTASVGFEDIANGAKGYYSVPENRIALRNGMSELQTIKTLAHEVTHSVLHGKDCELSRDEKEIQAESTAFIVCSYFGLQDVGDYSFEYLSSWTDGNTEKIKPCVEVITKTAHGFIEAVDAFLAADAAQEEPIAV